MKSPFSRFFGGGKIEPTVSSEVTATVEEEQEQQVKTTEEVLKIPIDKIIPNRFQPRTVFDEEKLKNYQEQFIHTV